MPLPPRPDATALLSRLKYDIAATRVIQAAHRLRAVLEKYDPAQPRVPSGQPGGGQWTSGSGSIDDVLAGLLEALNENSLLQEVAWPGDFHDVVRDYLVDGLRAAGHTIETEVGLVLPGTPPFAARIDILGRDPDAVLYGVEVKTGDDPTFTPGQQVVYPHAIGGAGVVSFDPKVRNLDLQPGKPLPAFAIRVAYSRAPGEPIELIPLRAEPR